MEMILGARGGKVWCEYLRVRREAKEREQVASPAAVGYLRRSNTR
jgi:hypothetical protein